MGYVAEMLRFGIGGVAGERNVETHVQTAFGVIQSAGEAVEDAAEGCRFPVQFELGEAVVPGVPAMNDDRQLSRVSQLHLCAEDRCLHVARRMIVEIIQTDFAPGNDFAMLREAGEFVEVMLGDCLGFVRVDADTGVDPFVLFGEW